MFLKVHALASILRFCLIISIVTNISENALEAQEARIFSNKTGVKIKATFIEMAGDTEIKIKRASDGQEFILKLANLSSADQEYITEILLEKKEGKEVFNRPQTLHINLSHHRDTVTVDSLGGTYSSLSNEYIKNRINKSSKEIRLDIPAGTWISFRPHQKRSVFYVPYLGGKRWEFKIDSNQTIWLTRDKSEREIIGVALIHKTFKGWKTSNNADARKVLNAVDFSKVKNVFHLHLAKNSDYDFLSHIPDDLPLSLSIVSRMQRSRNLRKLAKKNLVGLNLSIQAGDTAHLADFRNLKFLSLMLDFESEKKGVAIPELKSLEHFSVGKYATYNKRTKITEPFIDWPTSLKHLPNLRVLQIVEPKTSQEFDSLKTSTKLLTSFAKNPRLAFLEVVTNFPSFFSPKSLATAKGLEYLKLNEGVIFSDEEDFSALELLRKLRVFRMEKQSLSTEEMDKLFRSGNLNMLVDYSGEYVPESEHCPKLEVLSIEQPENGALNLERLAIPFKALKHCSFTGIRGEELSKISEKTMNGLSSLALTSCFLNSSEVMNKAKGLKYLSLSVTQGRLTQIDLRQFPNLEKADFSSNSTLASIKGISSHPALRNISISNMPNLSYLGESAPNSRIESLYLNDLESLRDIQCLYELDGLKALTILRSGSRSSFSRIEKNNTNLEEKLFIERK